MLLSANIFNGKIKKELSAFSMLIACCVSVIFVKKVIDSGYSPVNLQIKKYYSS